VSTYGLYVQMALVAEHLPRHRIKSKYLVLQVCSFGRAGKPPSLPSTRQRVSRPPVACGRASAPCRIHVAAASVSAPEGRALMCRTVGHARGAAGAGEPAVHHADDGGGHGAQRRHAAAELPALLVPPPVRGDGGARHVQVTPAAPFTHGLTGSPCELFVFRSASRQMMEWLLFDGGAGSFMRLGTSYVLLRDWWGIPSSIDCTESELLFVQPHGSHAVGHAGCVPRGGAAGRLAARLVFPPRRLAPPRVAARHHHGRTCPSPPPPPCVPEL
jgi:hypothetical protein